MASVFHKVGMAENKPVKLKGFSIDWLIKGSLTKIGDIFDRLTGRGWKPSSSLATSELIERMKSLMDAEVRENGHKRKYVPHNIKLKMQWDKFSADSDTAMKKLENEFLVAAVDHINDCHYYTYSPLSITIKPDYFTSGVVLLVSFDKFDADEHEAAINVTVDSIKGEKTAPAPIVEKQKGTLAVRFEAAGKHVVKSLDLEDGKRLSVGRTKENSLQIDDTSISKAHASLLLNKDGKLVVADTGSTNGTFVNGERIAYGKAVELNSGAKLMFGLINVSFDFRLAESVSSAPVPAVTEAYKVGELEFSTRKVEESRIENPPGPTVASIPVPKVDTIPINKPDLSEAIEEMVKKNEVSPKIAPQPAITEPGIDVDKKNTGQ